MLALARLAGSLTTHVDIAVVGIAYEAMSTPKVSSRSRHLRIDCFADASGDMFSGALCSLNDGLFECLNVNNC